MPRFCYHDRLSIAGNCRMCLVGMEKSPKPIASCAMPAGEGMVIHTNTPEVKKAREGVMEFLLINHPLDCPICDQGGECDLQDQADGLWRPFQPRFNENKRAVKDKDVGPLIEDHHDALHSLHPLHPFRRPKLPASRNSGATCSAARHMEDRHLRGEGCIFGTLRQYDRSMSGRRVDLEALRLHRALLGIAQDRDPSTCIDAVGSNIRIDARGGEVMRIVPRLNEDVNEEWISDKSRYACDGLKRQAPLGPLLCAQEWQTGRTRLARGL